MLVDLPVGENPVGGACSVATVVISSDGKGDRPVESLQVKVVGRHDTRERWPHPVAHLKDTQCLDPEDKEATGGATRCNIA